MWGDNGSRSTAAGEAAIGVSPSEHQPEARPELSPEDLQKRAQLSKEFATALGECVAILMRSPQYKHHSLTDLEWMVAPALATGQFVIVNAQSKTSGISAPVGLVMWARVSEEVDQRLSRDLTKPIRLRPDEWASGDIHWLVDAVGEVQVLGGVLKQLLDTKLNNTAVKTRSIRSDGLPAIRVLRKNGEASE